MDTAWLIPLVAALVGAALSASACRWWFGRSMKMMHRRLEQSEHARHAAHERSLQARQQIEQLTRMVSSLQMRQKQSLEAQQQQRRAHLERTLEAAEVRPALPANGFADTQPM